MQWTNRGPSANLIPTLRGRIPCDFEAAVLSIKTSSRHFENHARSHFTPRFSQTHLRRAGRNDGRHRGRLFIRRKEAKAEVVDLHACRGLNECKGQGSDKKNDCAGKGDLFDRQGAFLFGSERLQTSRGLRHQRKSERLPHQRRMQCADEGRYVAESPDPLRRANEERLQASRRRSGGTGQVTPPRTVRFATKPCCRVPRCADCRNESLG